MIDIKLYKRTDHNYLAIAVQVTDHNLVEVAEWCGGEVGWKDDQRVYVAVPVRTSQQKFQKAFVGDFVLKVVGGEWKKPKSYRRDSFYKSFDLVED